MDEPGREQRDSTSMVVPVTLTLGRDSGSDVAPQRLRTRWLSGDRLRDQLASRQADARFARDLDELAGGRIDEL